MPGFGISHNRCMAPKTGSVMTVGKRGIQCLVIREQGIVWLTPLEKCLVLELPTQKLQYGLNECLFQAGLDSIAVDPRLLFLP